ncbi:CHASE3 domain-containing protein [Sphingobium boeckii]|uniref:histidine kinase n=1 Tax=Sphingobium boeckii TaxID=1082345 RepID=A0A7W9AKJ2_9SPHN|nr:CHASE3 domain-containing protein [Sphingobium boeckii]MBB5687162.1 signal transduction histidine kinase [Sphingobium boeckii]
MTGDKLSWRALWPILLGFAVLTGMVGASLWLARGQEAAGVEAGRLFDYQASLLEALSATKDAEIGQRGYVLTGAPTYLAPYESGASRAGAALDDIARHGGTHGVAVAAALRPLVNAKMAEMRDTVALTAKGDHIGALAIVRSDRGMAIMDRIRATVGSEVRATRARLEASRTAAAMQAQALNVGLVAGLLVVLLTAYFWIRSSRQQLIGMRAARDEARITYNALRSENTAREAAEGQVRQMQKMESIGQLTGGIAHDFNNMLAIVIGNLDLAARRIESDPKKALRSIAGAQEGAERAATLTARLLAFSRQQPLAPEALDANKLVTSMSELLRRTLDEQVPIETVLAGGLWRTMADAGQLENAIVNLAVNARDAMPDGGKLTIETANAHLDDAYAASRAEVTPGQYVLICVSDTGTGMAPEVIERAFDPFFTTKAVGKGTGLGLSQVFGFVKQSGGHIAIYSEVGDGTTIKMYLPRAFGTVDAARPAESEDDVPRGRTEEVILVVEDEERVRHFAVDALRELGYTTVSAGSGAEALKILAEQPSVAMLFTDVVMPEMDGRRLVEAAKIDRPGLKVVYTTGYTRNAVVHNGRLDAGVNLLAKPYSIAQLARKIRGALDEI